MQGIEAIRLEGKRTITCIAILFFIQRVFTLETEINLKLRNWKAFLYAVLIIIG